MEFPVFLGVAYAVLTRYSELAVCLVWVATQLGLVTHKVLRGTDATAVTSLLKKAFTVPTTFIANNTERPMGIMFRVSGGVAFASVFEGTPSYGESRYTVHLVCANATYLRLFKPSLKASSPSDARASVDIITQTGSLQYQEFQKHKQSLLREKEIRPHQRAMIDAFAQSYKAHIARDGIHCDAGYFVSGPTEAGKSECILSLIDALGIKKVILGDELARPGFSAAAAHSYADNETVAYYFPEIDKVLKKLLCVDGAEAETSQYQRTPISNKSELNQFIDSLPPDTLIISASNMSLAEIKIKILDVVEPGVGSIARRLFGHTHVFDVDPPPRRGLHVKNARVRACVR